MIEQIKKAALETLVIEADAVEKLNPVLMRNSLQLCSASWTARPASW